MPATKGPLGTPLQTFIFRVLIFCDRVLVLRDSRKLEYLNFKNIRLIIFDDYSVDTQRLRRTFDQMKLQLRNEGIKYSMLFPACLRVQDGCTYSILKQEKGN